jgi:hypothetical protein
MPPPLVGRQEHLRRTDPGWGLKRPGDFAQQREGPPVGDTRAWALPLTILHLPSYPFFGIYKRSGL